MLAYATAPLIARRWPSPDATPAPRPSYDPDDDYWALLPHSAPAEIVVDQPLVGFLIGAALSAVLWGVIAVVTWIVLF